MPALAKNITVWLESIGMQKYRKVFADAEIDISILPEITDADLKELGLPVGPRRRIAEAVRALRESSSQPAGTALPSEQKPAASGAERRQLTLMFADLVGSTRLSERLDPEDMSEVIRAYQNAVAGEITRLGGQVAKFMGDGVLSYFGWPHAHEDSAERAVRAGVATTAAVAELVAAGKPLAARVGIATGLVVVGDLVGEGAAREESVVGPTPNLASRLQESAKPGQVVVSDSTRKLIRSAFEIENLGKRELKGIREPVELFAISEERSAESRFAARARGEETPLLGRKAETEIVGRCWAEAQTGRGQLILVEGEAGIGKSHFVEALARTLPGAFGRVIWQCSPYHAGSPFWPVTQQLARTVGIANNAGSEANLVRLENFLSENFSDVGDAPRHLAVLLGLDAARRYGAAATTPAQQRTAILDTLVGLLRDMARRTPVLWLIEDAHWIDPTTLELMERALDCIESERILAIVTAREPLGERFTGHPSVTRISLRRLDGALVGAMIARITGGKALPMTVAKKIASQADGVPLFVEEITKTVLESGMLRESETGWQLDAPISQIPVPASLQDALLARLDRMDAHKEVAQIAAVIGRVFDRPTLRELSGFSQEAMAAALDRLVKAGLVRQAGPIAAELYQFKHALLRDAAYESLLRRRRQSLHCSLLQIMEAAGGYAPEILARHAEAGNELDRAITLWCQAGSAAIARGSFDEAGVHLDAAAAVSAELDDDAGRRNAAASIAVTRAIASLVERGHGDSRTCDLFAQASSLARDADDGEHAVAAAYGLWAFHYVHGDVHEALRIGRVLCEDGRARKDPTMENVASSLVGIALTLSGDLRTARSTMEGAMPAISAGAAERLRARVGFDLAKSAQCYLARVELVCGETERSRSYAETVEATNTDGEEVNGRAFKLSHAGGLAAESGDFARAAEIGRTMLSFSQQHGLLFWEPFGHAYIGWHMLADGKVAAAKELLARAHEVMERQGGGQMASLVAGLLAEASAACGDVRALALITEAEERARATGRCFGLAETQRRRGRVLQNLHPEADNQIESAFRAAIKTASGQGAILWEIRAGCDLARFLTRRGRTNEGRALLLPILPRWTGAGNLPDIVAARALLETESA